MVYSNIVKHSKLVLVIACSALAVVIFAPAASADTKFFEDFNDGNAQDGIPVTWAPALGTWDASSGDYVATGSSPRVSLVPAYVLGNTSARTQVRVVGSINAVLGVRRTLPLAGYAGSLRPDGTLTVERIDGAPPPVILGNAVVPFNLVQQDVMLQFDAIDDKLSLWAWPVGQPMPNEPQVVAFDNTYAEGPVGLISSGLAGGPTDSTTFRFVQVADTHITHTVPEPSTLVLMSLAGCGLLYAWRRKRA